MIVQVFEPGEGGHFTNYIEALLPALTQLLEEARIRKIVITTRRSHLDAPAFKNQLLRYASKVHFDASLPSLAHTPRSARALAAALLESIARFQPDYLIATTADFESVVLAIRSVMRRRTFPKELHSVGVFHYGYAGMATSLADHFKDGVYRFSWRFSPWSELRIVNPLFYEALRKSEKVAPARLSVLPHPVKRFARIEKAAARETLGIPVDGRYLGCAGIVDRRRAIPELLAAFREATSLRTDRLLLAGCLCEPYKALIERDFADLQRDQRLIVLDRYLTESELNAGLCALDVAALTYYPRPNLSANLLEAVAAHRPVIADSSGYTGMAVKRFDLGWSCDIRDPASLASTIHTALEASGEYRPSARTERLMAFHDPKNYAASVLSALYVSVGLASPELKTWEWATGLAEGPSSAAGRSPGIAT